MIKLEDFKIGDKIYGVSYDVGSLHVGLYQESIVQKELFMLDNHPKPCEAVLCKGGIEIVTRLYEKYLFRTQEEAEQELHNIRLNLAKELIKSGEFIDRLFQCAISSERLSKYEERPIYELAVKLYKENLSNE